MQMETYLREGGAFAFMKCMQRALEFSRINAWMEVTWQGSVIMRSCVFSGLQKASDASILNRDSTLRFYVLDDTAGRTDGWS